MNQPTSKRIAFELTIWGPGEVILAKTRFTSDNGYHAWQAPSFSAPTVIRVEVQALTDEKETVQTFDPFKVKRDNGKPYSIGSKHWTGLSKLIEETGEVSQVCGKILGTGGQEQHWDGTNLRSRLEEEIADLQAAIDFVCSQNGVRRSAEGGSRGGENVHVDRASQNGVHAQADSVAAHRSPEPTSGLLWLCHLCALVARVVPLEETCAARGGETKCEACGCVIRAGEAHGFKRAHRAPQPTHAPESGAAAYELGRKDGAFAERGFIVSWLRWEADHRPSPTDQRLRDAARDIEGLAHHGHERRGDAGVSRLDVVPSALRADGEPRSGVDVVGDDGSAPGDSSKQAPSSAVPDHARGVVDAGGDGGAARTRTLGTAALRFAVGDRVRLIAKVAALSPVGSVGVIERSWPGYERKGMPPMPETFHVDELVGPDGERYPGIVVPASVLDIVPTVPLCDGGGKVRDETGLYRRRCAGCAACEAGPAHRAISPSYTPEGEPEHGPCGHLLTEHGGFCLSDRCINDADSLPHLEGK